LTRVMQLEKIQIKNLYEQAKRLYESPPNPGHAKRTIDKEELLQDIKHCIESGCKTASMSLRLISNDSIAVLDVGCSWGPLVFGAAFSQAVSEAYGIDIEQDAVALGKAVRESGLVCDYVAKKVELNASPAECIPYSDGKFDLVICHTVLEHVIDIETTVREMYRVLKPGGLLHIIAPNYLWPYEPHLRLYMFPLGPKWLVKLFAKALRKEALSYVDDLNFIHPFMMERVFRKYNMDYKNNYLNKLNDILIEGNYQVIIGLKKFIFILRVLKKLKLSKLLFWVVKRIPIYPSLEYIIRK